MRAALLYLGLLTACGESRREVRKATVAADSAADDRFAAAVMIERFRVTVPERPVQLGGGATTSVDSLLARYVRGIEHRDTTLLASLRLTVSEFAWLYYADSPMAQAPYELDPDVMWMQLAAQSERGLARTSTLYGGRSFGAWRSACDAPRVAGALRLRECAITVPRAAAPLRLSVVERDGRFKLVGLGTGL